MKIRWKTPNTRKKVTRKAWKNMQRKELNCNERKAK